MKKVDGVEQIVCRDCGCLTERLGRRHFYCPKCKRERKLKQLKLYRERPEVRERTRVYMREYMREYMKAKRAHEQEEAKR